MLRNLSYHQIFILSNNSIKADMFKTILTPDTESYEIVHNISEWTICLILLQSVRGLYYITININNYDNNNLSI